MKPCSPSTVRPRDIVGGRLTPGQGHKRPRTCSNTRTSKHPLAVEKAQLLAQIGLIQGYVHAVVDEQTWVIIYIAIASGVCQAAAEDVVRVKERIGRGEAQREDWDNLSLPRLSYVRSSFYTNRWFGAVYLGGFPFPA